MYKEILVRNAKGHKHRRVGINHEISKPFHEYINIHRPKTDLDYVFVLPNGKALTRDRVEKRIKILMKKAGMEGLMHSFRRGCFTYYANRNVPITSLRLIAGHSSILTTQNYIRPDIEEVLKQQINW